ncbi:MAG: hypothetical protein BGN83_16250 [Rhizobium sp. 63-7]|nr:MAG: hypothetical protein BGN83_16250 [Rhizobium sp. 63-7]
MRGFMQATHGWEGRLDAVTADGFFKVMTRRHPSAECWAWALEWNHSMRLIGFFGERAPAQDIVNGFPPMGWKTVHASSTRTSRSRLEVLLGENDDTLFRRL